MKGMPGWYVEKQMEEEWSLRKSFPRSFDQLPSPDSNTKLSLECWVTSFDVYHNIVCKHFPKCRSTRVTPVNSGTPRFFQCLFKDSIGGSSSILKKATCYHWYPVGWFWPIRLLLSRHQGVEGAERAEWRESSVMRNATKSWLLKTVLNTPWFLWWKKEAKVGCLALKRGTTFGWTFKYFQ